jgi:23S rRNA (uracil1939-C5)-methyltransferase
LPVAPLYGRMDTHTIAALGHAGDGIAATPDGPVFVPFTAPGDRVRLAPDGPGRARVVELVEASPLRADPACAHFGACGGCALQHLAPGAYAAWKRDQVVAALRQRGFADPPVEPAIVIPAATRRRARFAWQRAKGRAVLGFQRRASHDLIDLAQCPVLTPALWAIVDPLRNFLADEAKRWPKGAVEAVATETGLDLLFLAAPAPDTPLRIALPAFGAAHGVARLSWVPRDGAAPELLAQLRAPRLGFDGIRVTPPPGVFLQPSQEGEAVLRGLVRDGLAMRSASPISIAASAPSPCRSPADGRCAPPTAMPRPSPRCRRRRGRRAWRSWPTCATCSAGPSRPTT